MVMEPPTFPARGTLTARAAPGSDACLLLPAPSGTPPFHYEWSRAGASLDDRFTTSDDAGGVRLTVSAARTGDSGVYTLQASNAAGRDTARVRLEVAADELPTGDDPPTFLRRLQDLTVKVGTRTRFLVEIVSSTECKVTWYRNERRLMEAERVSLIRDGSFWCAELAAVSVDDTGRWTCSAENAGGRASCSAHLNVLVPKAYKRPEFVEELRALLTEQGTVSLECKVVGVPTPVLRWFKDSREIKAGDVFALTASAEDPTSLGTYTCEAVNCMGRAYSSSKVHVVGRTTKERTAAGVTPDPPPIFTKELEDQLVRICEPLTLSCSVMVPPWPRSVVWYNKEGKLEPSERYHVVEDGVGGYLVEVAAAEWPDEGEWKCVATSAGGRVGISTCYVSMDVPKNYRKPRFMENLQAVLTEEGLVSFECKVVGFPTPVLSWFKDGQELKPGDVYQLTGTNSLGSYCCIARNCMGQASSSAELTVEDIQNQLNEDEKLQLFSKNQAPKFIQGLKSVEAKIDEPFRFTIKVAIPPEPSVLWYRDDQPVDESNRCHLSKEERGVFNLDIQALELLDQAEWKCVAMNDFGHSVTSCFLKLIIPRHYKKPRFLENLQAILSDEGAVNLECKVIGVPQPVLKWYKDGEELKPGDIHRIISGQDGTCCLGTYTCEAQNCMGIAASSASLLGFDDSMKAKNKKKAEEQALQRNLSLSTIHEERTSQMYDTPVGDITLDDKGEISFSFDGKEVSVSLYETPDLTEEEALQIVEMYADQLSENVTEHNVVELPPLRFVKETSTSGNLLMEAIIIDVSPEYFASPEEDLRTEADVEDISIADENGPPQLSLDQDIGGEDYLEKTMALLSEEKSDIPKKLPRKKSDSQKSADDFYSLSRDQSLSEEKKDDDTQVLSESDLQSFASARSLSKPKSKSSKPSLEDGQESSDVTKTILNKEEVQNKKLEPDTPPKPKRERRSSRSSRRSSSGSEKSFSKSGDEPKVRKIQADVEQKPKNISLSDEEFKEKITSISASLAKIINDVQIIERDIILKSELMSSAATASRSLEIISSIIKPLSEIQSIADVVKESALESKEVSSTLFINLPQSLKTLHQSLTILEKCIDVESDNKTLVKKTCVAFIETCGEEMKKWMNDIANITEKEYIISEPKTITEINSYVNEMNAVIRFSADTIKARNLLSEASEIKVEEPSIETKHLRDTQRALFELKSPLYSLLSIVDTADSTKLTEINRVTSSEVILNDMSASIQDLQAALEQIEALSVKESTTTVRKYNTEIIETVMESVLKLRSSFEQLSIEAKSEEDKELLKGVLTSIKNNLSDVSSQIQTIELNVGSFDILQSENKLEILQKMAQILISLENSTPRLETIPEVKTQMDVFHKNLTKVLENVIESNDAKKYFTFMEICDAVNRINTAILNINVDHVLYLSSINNTLSIVQEMFVKNVFESELNCAILTNITDLLLSVQEVLNRADEISIQLDSEHAQDIPAMVFEADKANVIVEHIDQTIAIIDTVKTIETTTDIKMKVAPIFESICPILEDFKRNIGCVRSEDIPGSEHVSELSDASLVKSLAKPLLELNQNILTLNQVIIENLDSLKENTEIASAFAEPLHELYTTLQIIQQDVISQYGEDIAPYDVSINMLSAVQNLQSCIVMIEEPHAGEGIDEMSTLEDISGIKTTAETLPSDRLVLPSAEELNIQQSVETFDQEAVLSATAQTLQMLNEHIAVLQNPEVLDALDTLSEVSDYSSLKSVALGLGELHVGLEEILHPLVIESSDEINYLPNTHKLAAIAEPLQELHQSLSVLDSNNIPIFEHILEMPTERINIVLNNIFGFKEFLGKCMEVVFPAMETTDKTIEISNKVETLRAVCERLKNILHMSRTISSEVTKNEEIQTLEEIVNNLLNATDVSRGIQIYEVKDVTEKLYEKILAVQEDLIQYTPLTPESICEEAKLVQTIDEIETNIAVLEQYDFVDLSHVSQLTSCTTPQLAAEIEMSSLMQMDDILQNAVNVVQDSEPITAVADLMILEDFFVTCKNEFTILRHLITKGMSHKKIIRLIHEFGFLQKFMKDFQAKRQDLKFTKDINDYLSSFFAQSNENLETVQKLILKLLNSQSELLFNGPAEKIEKLSEVLKDSLNKQAIKSNAIEEVIVIFLNIIELAKPKIRNLQDNLRKEIIDPTTEIPEDDLILYDEMEHFIKIVEEQCSSSSLDNFNKNILQKILTCLQKHQNFKDATGSGKYLIVSKCISECSEILQNITVAASASDISTVKKEKVEDNALKIVLSEMLEPLQALRDQITSIQEKVCSNPEEDSVSLDLTTTESLVETMSEIHKQFVEHIESSNTAVVNENISLIMEADNEIHAIQESLKSMENTAAVQDLKEITKPIESVEKTLHSILVKDDEKEIVETLPKDVNSNIDSLENALDRFINIEKDILAVVDIFSDIDIKECLKLAHEIKNVSEIAALVDKKWEIISSLRTALSQHDWLNTEKYTEGKNPSEKEKLTNIYLTTYQLLAELGLPEDNTINDILIEVKTKGILPLTLQRVEQYIELLEVVEETSVVLKLENLKETLDIARELRDSFFTCEETPESETNLNNTHAELALKLQSALSTLQLQVLDTVLEISPDINKDLLQRVVQATSCLRDDLAAVTSTQTATSVRLSTSELVTEKLHESKVFSEYAESDAHPSQSGDTKIVVLETPTTMALECSEDMFTESTSILTVENTEAYLEKENAADASVITCDAVQKTVELALETVESARQEVSSAELLLTEPQSLNIAIASEITPAESLLDKEVELLPGEKITDLQVVSPHGDLATKTEVPLVRVAQSSKQEEITDQLKHYIEDFVSENILKVINDMPSLTNVEDFKQSIEIAKELQENIGAIETTAKLGPVESLELLQSNQNRLAQKLQNALSIAQEQLFENLQNYSSVEENKVQKVANVTLNLQTSLASVVNSSPNIEVQPPEPFVSTTAQVEITPSEKIEAVVTEEVTIVMSEGVGDDSHAKADSYLIENITIETEVVNPEERIQDSIQDSHCAEATLPSVILSGENEGLASVLSDQDIPTDQKSVAIETERTQILLNTENKKTALVSNKLLQHIEEFLSDEITEAIEELSVISSKDLKDTVNIAKELRENVAIAIVPVHVEEISHLIQENQSKQVQIKEKFCKALTTLITDVLEKAQEVTPVLTPEKLEKIFQIVTHLQEDLQTIRTPMELLSPPNDSLTETTREESMKQLEDLLKDVSDRIDLSSGDRSVEDTELLRDNLDEVQTVIIKLKRDFDGAANDTLNETLEDLECSVRSVQLQITEESPPDLLKEACATLQLLVNNMSETQEVNVAETEYKEIKTEDVMEKCSDETEQTMQLLDIASHVDIAGRSHLSDIVANLNSLRNTMKSLKMGFSGNSDTLIEKGIDIIQNLDQIEEKVFSIEKDIDSETNLPPYIRDSIITAVHSVYGSISNMRSTIASIQKQYMFENYGKPSENFLKSIRILSYLCNSEETEQKKWKKMSKSLRSVLKHFEDIKFYINLDKTARLPSDAAFTKIILEELKNDIKLINTTERLDSDTTQKIENAFKCVESHLRSIETRSSVEVKEKIPIFKEISSHILDVTKNIRNNLISNQDKEIEKANEADASTQSAQETVVDAINVSGVSQKLENVFSCEHKELANDENKKVASINEENSSIQKAVFAEDNNKTQELDNLQNLKKDHTEVQITAEDTYESHIKQKEPTLPEPGTSGKEDSKGESETDLKDEQMHDKIQATSITEQIDNVPQTLPDFETNDKVNVKKDKIVSRLMPDGGEPILEGESSKERVPKEENVDDENVPKTMSKDERNSLEKAHKAEELIEVEQNVASQKAQIEKQETKDSNQVIKIQNQTEEHLMSENVDEDKVEMQKQDMQYNITAGQSTEQEDISLKQEAEKRLQSGVTDREKVLTEEKKTGEKLEEKEKDEEKYVTGNTDKENKEFTVHQVKKEVLLEVKEQKQDIDDNLQIRKEEDKEEQSDIEKQELRTKQADKNLVEEEKPEKEIKSQEQEALLKQKNIEGESDQQNLEQKYKPLSPQIDDNEKQEQALVVKLKTEDTTLKETIEKEETAEKKEAKNKVHEKKEKEKREKLAKEEMVKKPTIEKDQDTLIHPEKIDEESCCKQEFVPLQEQELNIDKAKREKEEGATIEKQRVDDEGGIEKESDKKEEDEKEKARKEKKIAKQKLQDEQENRNEQAAKEKTEKETKEKEEEFLVDQKQQQAGASQQQTKEKSQIKQEQEMQEKEEHLHCEKDKEEQTLIEKQKLDEMMRSKQESDEKEQAGIEKQKQQKIIEKTRLKQELEQKVNEKQVKEQQPRDLEKKEEEMRPTLAAEEKDNTEKEKGKCKETLLKDQDKMELAEKENFEKANKEKKKKDLLQQENLKEASPHRHKQEWQEQDEITVTEKQKMEKETSLEQTAETKKVEEKQKLESAKTVLQEELEDKGEPELDKNKKSKMERKESEQEAFKLQQVKEIESRLKQEVEEEEKQEKELQKIEEQLQHETESKDEEEIRLKQNVTENAKFKIDESEGKKILEEKHEKNEKQGEAEKETKDKQQKLEEESQIKQKPEQRELLEKEEQLRTEKASKEKEQALIEKQKMDDDLRLKKEAEGKEEAETVKKEKKDSNKMLPEEQEKKEKKLEALLQQQKIEEESCLKQALEQKEKQEIKRIEKEEQLRIEEKKKEKEEISLKQEAEDKYDGEKEKAKKEKRNSKKNLQEEKEKELAEKEKEQMPLKRQQKEEDELRLKQELEQKERQENEEQLCLKKQRKDEETSRLKQKVENAEKTEEEKAQKMLTGEQEKQEKFILAEQENDVIEKKQEALKQKKEELHLKQELEQNEKEEKKREEKGKLLCLETEKKETEDMRLKQEAEEKDKADKEEAKKEKRDTKKKHQEEKEIKEKELAEKEKEQEALKQQQKEENEFRLKQELEQKEKEEKERQEKEKSLRLETEKKETEDMRLQQEEEDKNKAEKEKAKEEKRQSKKNRLEEKEKKEKELAEKEKEQEALKQQQKEEELRLKQELEQKENEEKERQEKEKRLRLEIEKKEAEDMRLQQEEEDKNKAEKEKAKEEKRQSKKNLLEEKEKKEKELAEKEKEQEAFKQQQKEDNELRLKQELEQKENEEKERQEKEKSLRLEIEKKETEDMRLQQEEEDKKKAEKEKAKEEKRQSKKNRLEEKEKKEKELAEKEKEQEALKQQQKEEELRLKQELEQKENEEKERQEKEKGFRLETEKKETENMRLQQEEEDKNKAEKAKAKEEKRQSKKNLLEEKEKKEKELAEKEKEQEALKQQQKEEELRLKQELEQKENEEKERQEKEKCLCLETEKKETEDMRLQQEDEDKNIAEKEKAKKEKRQSKINLLEEKEKKEKELVKNEKEKKEKEEKDLKQLQKEQEELRLNQGFEQKEIKDKERNEKEKQEKKEELCLKAEKKEKEATLNRQRSEDEERADKEERDANKKLQEGNEKQDLVEKEKAENEKKQKEQEALTHRLKIEEESCLKQEIEDKEKHERESKKAKEEQLRLETENKEKEAMRLQQEAEEKDKSEKVKKEKSDSKKKLQEEKEKREKAEKETKEKEQVALERQQKQEEELRLKQELEQREKQEKEEQLYLEKERKDKEEALLKQKAEENAEAEKEKAEAEKEKAKKEKRDAKKKLQEEEEKKSQAQAEKEKETKRNEQEALIQQQEIEEELRFKQELEQKERQEKEIKEKEEIRLKQEAEEKDRAEKEKVKKERRESKKKLQEDKEKKDKELAEKEKAEKEKKEREQEALKQQQKVEEELRLKREMEEKEKQDKEEQLRLEKEKEEMRLKQEAEVKDKAEKVKNEERDSKKKLQEEKKTREKTEKETKEKEQEAHKQQQMIEEKLRLKQEHEQKEKQEKEEQLRLEKEKKDKETKNNLKEEKEKNKKRDLAEKEKSKIEKKQKEQEDFIQQHKKEEQQRLEKELELKEEKEKQLRQEAEEKEKAKMDEAKKIKKESKKKIQKEQEIKEKQTLIAREKEETVESYEKEQPNERQEHGEKESFSFEQEMKDKDKTSKEMEKQIANQERKEIRGRIETKFIERKREKDENDTLIKKRTTGDFQDVTSIQQIDQKEHSSVSNDATQHYIKEYHYEPTGRMKLDDKERPRFIDHNHRDYTMEFVRPSGYRERSFDMDNLAPEWERNGRSSTIYKASSLRLDAQLRSSLPPQPQNTKSGEVTERRSEVRLRSKALSEARSVLSEKRSSVPRDIKRKPVFSTYLTDRTAVEGSRVKLTCSVLSSGDPKVTWYRNGVLLDDKLKYRTKMVDGLITLEVLNAVPSDSAEYSCTVQNENGSVNTSANLKVYPSFEASPIPPTFTRSIRDTYHLAENELVLECRIRGQPLPTISWLKDDRPICSNERYQAYYLADGVCRLAISHPTPEDSGKYTCKAENSMWSDQITHVVNFTGRESRLSPNLATVEKSRISRQNLESRRPHFSNVLTDYQVTKGGTIGLQVEIKGSPTRVEWLREGRSVTDTYTNARTFVEQGLYTLALSDVTERESGLYTCRAFSTHGAVDMNAAITVVQPNELDGKPAIIIGRPEKDVLISIGEDLNISFRVQGEPKPKVIFMKGIRDITSSQRVCKMTSDDYVKFTVKRTVISDAGTYCILARNAYGCDRAFVTVVIRQRASSENLISDWTYPIDDSSLPIVERKYKSVPERIPGEPSVVDGGNNWVSLAWPKPDPSAAAPVLAYKVESWLAGKEGGARWTELGITPLNSFDAFNLKQGEEYHFRVTPRNRYGWGESVQTSTPVGVGSAGDRPEFVDCLPGQLKVLVGQTANLSCSVKGKPTPEVVWMKNGHEIEDGERRVRSSFNGYDCNLTIGDITIEDEARYSCEASNAHGRASTYVRLAVVTDRVVWEADAKLKRERSADAAGDYPPQFTMRLRDRRVQATYPVRLTCQVVGSPPPTVTWYRDGQEVTLDARHTKSQDEHFHTLEIAPTTLEDGGVYEAMARNGCGAVSCHCSLVVDKGIRAYVAPEFCCGLEPLYRVHEGEELRITAVVEAYPSVGVTWYRDGVRLRPSRRAVMTLDRDGQTELALAAVTPRDAGVYSCTASNEVGRATTSAKVVVIGDGSSSGKMSPPVLISPDVPYSKEPMFVRKPRSSEAREGDTVIIECEVVGDPKPDVYWLRDFLKPDYYRDATHFKRVGDGPEYRFEIPHAKLDYTGAYSVVAKNVHGEAKAIISLQILAKDISSTEEHNIRYGRVEVIPRFERELTDLLCHDGDAVEFYCCVSGDPMPDIRWFHYTELIRECPDFEWSYEDGAARFKIKQVTAEDEGTYRCEASNRLGKASSSACLVVYPPGEPNTLSQRLRRPPALFSAASTPRSTPRTTPARSVSRTPGPDARRLCSPSRQMGPKFYTYPFNKVVEEGESVVFQCAVRGLPAPWATWDKDGVIITPSTRITIKEKDEILRILEIDEVTPEDVGLYRITLENDYGRVEASARLEVITQNGKFYAGVRSYSASPRRAHAYRRRSSSRQD